MTAAPSKHIQTKAARLTIAAVTADSCIVNGDHGQYTVTYDPPHCTCPGFAQWGLYCSHLERALLERPTIPREASMFKPLHELRTGSMVILTGLPGAGKSHLAAAARHGGTIWILDTEGAASALLGKPGIHPHIQAVQTLSLRTLQEAIHQLPKLGQPGDTVILDSISKVLQAMRSRAQQRAGGDVDKKASLAYDEHASVNRNMQGIYTSLTELKQAGFHIILIGHLAKSYKTNGGALIDDGMKVLADGKIDYEADAILLIERDRAGKRTLTPMSKPPRFAHLELGKSYPATLATIYPDAAAVAVEIPINRPKAIQRIRDLKQQYHLLTGAYAAIPPDPEGLDNPTLIDLGKTLVAAVEAAQADVAREAVR